eukprot:g2511.t1
MCCPRIVNNIHTRYLSKKFRTISVDLPGAGTLSGVQFSIARGVRVLKRVIDNEVSAAEQQLSVILVGMGGGNHVVVNAAKQYPGMCAGVIVAGNLSDYSCVECCRFGPCSAQLLRESWVAEFLDWRYEAVLLDCNRVSTSRSIQRFHWEIAPDWMKAVSGRSITRQLPRLKQKVMAISGHASDICSISREPGIVAFHVEGVAGDIMPSCAPETLQKMRTSFEDFANATIADDSALSFVERSSPMFNGGAGSSFSGDDEGIERVDLDSIDEFSGASTRHVRVTRKKT